QLTGQRLKDVPLSTFYHGLMPKAAQTAELIAASLPGVPVEVSDLAGDYLPSVPERDDLPPAFAAFLAGFSAAERADGPHTRTPHGAPATAVLRLGGQRLTWTESRAFRGVTVHDPRARRPEARMALMF